ncbi:MAG: PAS domain S-box protein [Bacillota bacterium]
MATRGLSRAPAWWKRYGNAFLAVAAAVLLRLSLTPVLGHESPLLILVVAIMVAAYAGGFGPGMLATMLSILFGTYLFVAPEHDLWRIDSANQIRLVTFLVVGTLISLLSEAIRRSRTRVEQAARDLAQTNAHVSDILSSITDCYLAIDHEWRLININVRAAEYFGVRPEQCLGRVIWELFPQLDGTPNQAVIRQAVSTSQPVHLEVPSAIKPGCWTEIHLYPRAGHLELYCRDITERKQAELELQRYRLLAENTNDIMLFVRLDDGRVLDANRAAIQTYGYTHDELLGLTIFDLRCPDTPIDLVREQMQQANRSGAFFQTTHRRKDGTVFPAEVGSQGAVLGGRRVLLSVVRDITERKQAEEALRESERFARAIVDAISLHLAILDEQGTILATNHAWREYARLHLGDDSHVGVGVHYLQVCDAVRGDDAPTAAAFAAGIRDVIAGSSRFFELEYPCRDGMETMWFVGRVTPFGGVGPVRVVVAHENITARKQAELQLERARQSAEAANAAKDRFLAVLSHELRTPLTPVLVTANMLEKDPSLPGEVRADMAMIGRNIALEARLIDDLLDLTRIARGKIELELRPVDLLSVLRHTSEIVSGEISQKGLRLNTVLGPGPYILHADVSRLQQVLLNLIKNAIKFTAAGGTITVRCFADNTGYVTTEITDTGIGIAPEALPRIFDAFEQADPSVTRIFGGLGLGLAISKTLAELHGGTLTAASDGKGQGATFRLQLPLYPAQLLPGLAASPWSDRANMTPPTRISTYRILLVEDHPDTSRIITRLLSTLGHEVVTADTVAAAREKLRQQSFDLLLSDLGLPDGSGIDLMGQLQVEGRSVRGIALSGFGMESDITRSRQAGFADHLTKPINFESLQQAITRVMDAQPVSPS